MRTKRYNNPLTLTKRVHRYSITLSVFLIVIFCFPSEAWSQTAVNRLFTTPQPANRQFFPDAPFAAPCDTTGTIPGCLNSNADLTFGNGNNTVLTGFQITQMDGSILIYEPATDLLPGGLTSRAEFRRVSIDVAIDGREIVFFENQTTTVTEVTVAPELSPSEAQPPTLANIMRSLIINRGVDNIFNNTTAGNQDTRNNIQRVDYIIDGGLTVPAADADNVGFLVLERGGNDRFGIAAITELEGMEEGLPAPSGYGDLVFREVNQWGTANNVEIATTVFRKNPSVNTEPLFRASHLVTPAQPVRGIFFPLSSLVAPGQTVFGYSLVAGSVAPPGNPNDLQNFRNSDIFATSTTGESSQGGLDLIAGGAVFRLSNVRQFGLLKRITSVLGPDAAALPPFNQVDAAASSGVIAGALNAAGLPPEGQTSITGVPLERGNTIEYTIYYASVGSNSNAVQICDRIPAGTTYAPGTIQTRGPGNPVPPAIDLLDGDAFIAAPAALPASCGPGPNERGAVVAPSPPATVPADEAGFIRFRVTVD